MSLFIVVDEDGNPLDARAALRDAIQHMVSDAVVETKYSEAVEAFTEEVRNGNRKPPFIYPHGVSDDTPVVRKKTPVQHPR